MNPRERMQAAFEGKPIDRIPVAPLFWGAEYGWKLTGLPIWEVLHGPGDMGMRVAEAIIERHDCDWVFLTHGSSHALVGKSQAREDQAHIYFTDDATGAEFVFHKEGHWLLPKDEVGKARLNHEGANVEPPQNQQEADDWLKRTHPHLCALPGEHIPSRKYRDRFPDRFLVGGVHCVFAGLAYSMGFEPALILLSENPSLAAYIMEKTMAIVPGQAARLAADGFDCGLMCDSWASADIMSPAVYRDYVAPFHKMASDELHKVGLKSIMYETGNILPFMDTIAAMGYDAVLPEERIKGVEIGIGEIRKGLGPETCVFGNFDSYLLMRGDREAIAADVKRQVSEAGPKSFVMCTGSPVCDATEPDVMDYWLAETRRAGRGPSSC